MVVSKDNVKKRQQIKSFEEASILAEAEIDKRLVGGNRCISASSITRFVSDYKKDFLNYVLNKYKEVGWKIREDNGYDPRDGDTWHTINFS